MDSHKIFEYFEEKVIRKAGEFYKKTLTSGLSKERDFNFISNNFIKILSDKEESTIPKSDQEFFDLLRIFKNRGQYYSNNDIVNIFKYELLENYNESKISNVVPYKEVVIRAAIYEGLTKSYAIISNHSNYFSMLYKFDEIENLVFTYDSNRLNELEYELRKKHYPENSQNIIEMTKDVIDENNNKEESRDIILHGIKFNLCEFALFQREWRDCNSPNTPFRELYDKVLMDFNDPYNYGSKKRYDSTTFYKILKEDYLNYKQSFDVCLAYDKVIELVGKTNNKVFKAHIINKLENVKLKLR